MSALQITFDVCRQHNMASLQAPHTDLGGSFGVPMFLIRLEMRKWTKNRIEEVLVSNSSLVSGLSEASGVKFSWVEVSQKV